MRNRVPHNRVLVLCLTAAVLASSGCATQRADVRVDKGDTDLGKCRTFDWRPVSSDAATFTDQRVRAAALKRLEDKGYQLATDKPDCQVTYVLSTQDRPKPKPSVGVGVGGGSGGARGGIGVSLPVGRHKEQIGTFTLDVVDVAQNAQIWSGSVDVGIQGRQVSDEEADEAVRLILEKFPDRAASK
ncbi:MAG TPA: DUF4136 domain-containing protein [Steroidobacteraceae bacterium]|jgi:hypothetical protein|nr:DUF4136 domain-containing protein [Steroidobacteraceae bacterium]